MLIMKIFKRNAIIITVILFVCVAVYLNWSYNRHDVTNDESQAALDMAENDGGSESALSLTRAKTATPKR